MCGHVLSIQKKIPEGIKHLTTRELNWKVVVVVAVLTLTRIIKSVGSQDRLQ